MTIVFWISVLGVIYSYLLYPLILSLLPKRGTVSDSAARSLPRVSVIIAAFNEKAQIREKLQNTLALDYPKDLLQVIVASDASTDGTDEIVQALSDQGVSLVRSTSRAGKEHAQTLAIAEASGEILVFSDVAAQIPKQTLRNLVKDFADERVGAVSSEDRLISPTGQIVGEGLYLKYEMWLRRLESRVNTVVGLTGAFFGVRRHLCDEWDVRTTSDMTAALDCIRHGYVAISDPDVVCYYSDIKDERREYGRKVRSTVRGWTAVFRRREVLNPLVYRLAAFQLWSHKVARWLVPWFLLSLLVSSMLLWQEHWAYRTLFAAQLFFYAAALVGLVWRRSRRLAVMRILAYFVMVNTAIAHATVAGLCGFHFNVWEPSKR